MHHLEKPRLEAFREAVLDPKRGRELAGIVLALRKKKYEIGNKTRAKVPRGFDPAHERAELLLHEGLSAAYRGPIPREASSARFVEWCAKHFEAIAPINDWLRRAVCR